MPEVLSGPRQASARCTYQMTFIEIMVMMMISIDMIIIIKLTTIRLMHNTHIGWPSLHSSDQGGTKSSEFKIKVTLY